MKAYKPLSPVETTAIDWTDTQTTFMDILEDGFQGLSEESGTAWGGLAAPIVAELSGIIVFPSQGDYILALSCDGWCNLSLYGSLLAESKLNEGFDETSQCTVQVGKAGPFPYRILYYQSRGRLGMRLRWSLSGDMFESVPPNRLFTDAHMEYASSGKLLTGSIAGTLLSGAVSAPLRCAPEQCSQKA